MTANLSRAEARHRSATVAVRDYRVELDLSASTDPARTTFPTTTTVRLTATAPETFLDFLGAAVHAVEVDGEARPVAFDGARVALDGLGGDHVVRVVGEATYSRTGEGLHRFVDPVDGATYLYTQYEPADARRVFACFEQPDLKAPFTFVVTAPADWHVLGNQPASAVTRDGDTATWTFPPTPPMSTYITAVVAGPYHGVAGEWRGADGLVVPLGVWCRASLAAHLDAEEILTVTRQGLDLFADRFAFPYPWGKYDQVFVPEYNLGAMENPGLVTFTEAYVFRSAATRAQRQGRATTILHEMAHMWFGDLVTPRWWDDLWLKESFADYMGTHAAAAATQYTDAWVAFAGRRKAWAYVQDQLPTTHPVVADIPDVEAAKQNFDGITYAKGASVLKQLVAYVGEDAFFAGARAYFRAHAYGSTTLADLLRELEAASGRDLGAWSRAWLETAGTATLTPVVELDDADRMSRLLIEQDAVDPATGEPTTRPHRLAVGLYRLDGDALVRTDRLELDVTGAVTEVADAAGRPAPDLVLANDDDLTYAKVRLDARSLATARAHLGGLRAPLARSLVWSALWNATRDGLLPAGAYVDAVLAHGPAESDSAVLQVLADDAVVAIERYTPAETRPALRAAWLEGTWTALTAAPAGTDAQLVWARALARAGAVVPAAAPRLRRVLDGAVAGLPLGPDLRWALWQALAAVGDAQAAELDAERQRDATADGATRHLAALSSLPTATVKADAWTRLLTPDLLTNDEVDATIAGFAQAWSADLTAPYTDDYFAALAEVWAARSIEIAGRLVRGLFPGRQDLAPGQQPADHPVVAATEAWLASNPEAPRALRRLVVEQEDHLRRALSAQAAARRLEWPTPEGW